MDIRVLAESYKNELRELAKHRKRHPPQDVLVPMQFPLSIRRAKSNILQLRSGHRAVQQVQEKFWAGHIRYPVDVWQMRQEFLSLEHREEELLAFLRKYGWWDSVDPIPVDDFWELQDMVSIALCSTANTCGRLISRRMFKGVEGPLFTRFLASFDYEGGTPRFVIETEGCLEAILASIQIDLVRNVKFRRCARPGCKEIFEISSGHEKKYHNSRCRSLEAMRRQREKRRQNIARIKSGKGKAA